MHQIIKISKLKPNPNNPRLVKDEKFKKLVKSIKDFPKMMELRPIITNEEMMILGGNMRLKACIEDGWKKIPCDIFTRSMSDDMNANLGPDEKPKTYKEHCDEFIIKDNVAFGENDMEVLFDWGKEKLLEWGMDLPNDWLVELDDLSDEFSLADGEKAPFQQMAFILADEQAEQIKNAISDIKKTKEYKHVETLGNENVNGNALYLIIMQWKETHN